MPWEIYVDAAGKRFMREDDPSVDQRERALLAQPDMSFWAVWDAGVAREAPPFFDLPDDIVAARFATLPGYRQADSLAELAILIGVDPAVLADTVATYNAGVADGTRDPLGREYRPRAIAEAPFYAVKHVGWSITSFAGVKIDAELRVVDAAGIPIPNLYAAGEIIGFGATSGNAFAGGMSVTPAMTFGRLLGTRLGQSATATAAA
jgi:fumarate reductase flavoprotein subunit